MGQRKTQDLSLFHLVLILIGGSNVLVSTPAIASYSPPLTRVRIDQDLNHHTPSIVFAQQAFASDPIKVDLSVTGVQYLGQFERKSGLGLQLGVTAGMAKLEGDFLKLSSILPGGKLVDASGYFLGWQARAYYMLWKSEVTEESRPHALTAFFNLRGIYYDAEDPVTRQSINFRSNTVTAGLGAMAEFSIHEYVSICPYAWVTPHIYTELNYGTESAKFTRIDEPNFRNPLLVGVDVWLYLFPPNWQDHISLSVLGSFLDTEDRGESLFAGVIGYTF